MLKERVILLLENSTDYLFQLDQAFRTAEISDRLRVARYGNEAILYLKGIGIYGDRAHYPLPELIIIDLSIPDGSALAVFGWIRRQVELSSVPILILYNDEHPKPALKHWNVSINTFYLNRENLEALVDRIKNVGRPSGAEGYGANPDPDDLELIS